MNCYHQSPLLEHLAAAYALGTLRGGARKRFETLAREFPAVRAAALVWQGHWAGIAELQTTVSPNPAVWIRINNLVQAQKESALRAQQRAKAQAAPAAANTASWWGSLLLWRGIAASALLATLAAVGISLQSQQNLQLAQGESQQRIAQLEAQLLATPQVRYVSVLADAKSAATMLVTFDSTRQQLTLQRVSGFQEGDDKSLQLWALPPDGAPRSLGVLGGDPLLKLPVPEGEVKAVPTLAISLEPKGGVPSEGGPTGPVLFTGALIERML